MLTVTENVVLGADDRRANHLEAKGFVKGENRGVFGILKTGMNIDLVGRLQQGTPYKKDGQDVYPPQDLIITEITIRESKATTEAREAAKAAAPAPANA